MSKARGPLLSVDATGKIGKSLIFFNWKGIHRVKQYKKPVQPDTQSQLDKRDIMKKGVQRWQWLLQLIKSFWNDAVKNIQKVMSGYNYFLSEYLNSMLVGETPSDYPPEKYYTNIPVLDGLISWWKLDEGQGNDLADSSDDNPATNNGATWIDGIIGKALSFNGSTNYVNIPTSAGGNLDPNVLTIEAWIKPNISDGVEEGVIFARNAWAETLVLWQYHTYYILRIDTSNDGGGIVETNTPADSVDPGEYQHLVGTYDGSNMKIYLNGVLQDTAPQTQLVNDGGDTAYLGIRYRDPPGNPSERFFDGAIDEVRIYNRALTEKEILHNFNYRP